MKVPPERRFTGAAADYARYRPSYPAALLGEHCTDWDEHPRGRDTVALVWTIR